MTADIEYLTAVPEDIAEAIGQWRDAASLLAWPRREGPPDDGVTERELWIAIGAAIREHVEEKVANALRMERGGCEYCPAENGGPHKMDCRRPGQVTRLNVEFKP